MRRANDDADTSPGAADAPRLDPTGVPQLDLVLGGGLPRGALTMIVGPPGSGKTTLASQMAFAAAQAGRRALILTTLAEPSNKLVAHLRSFAFYDEELLGEELSELRTRPLKVERKLRKMLPNFRPNWDPHAIELKSPRGGAMLGLRQKLPCP